MSWSISLIGKPENVVRALEEQSTKLTGQSKIEFDAALPHFVGLVKENFAENPPIVNFSASGHGMENGVHSYRQCKCNIDLIYATFV